jgi:hypothetical protein
VFRREMFHDCWQFRAALASLYRRSTPIRATIASKD